MRESHKYGRAEQLLTEYVAAKQEFAKNDNLNVKAIRQYLLSVYDVYQKAIKEDVDLPFEVDEFIFLTEHLLYNRLDRQSANSYNKELHSVKWLVEYIYNENSLYNYKQYAQEELAGYFEVNLASLKSSPVILENVLAKNKYKNPNEGQSLESQVMDFDDDQENAPNLTNSPNRAQRGQKRVADVGDIEYSWSKKSHRSEQVEPSLQASFSAR